MGEALITSRGGSVKTGILEKDLNDYDGSNGYLQCDDFIGARDILLWRDATHNNHFDAYYTDTMGLYSLMSLEIRDGTVARVDVIYSYNASGRWRTIVPGESVSETNGTQLTGATFDPITGKITLGSVGQYNDTASVKTKPSKDPCYFSYIVFN